MKSKVFALNPVCADFAYTYYKLLLRHVHIYDNIEI